MLAIPILSEIVGLGRTYLDGKIKIKQATNEAQAKIIEKSVDHQNKWEEIMATSSQTSWKDEYWTIVLSVPMIMCFFPGLQPYVIAGFKALEETPEWYQYLMLTAVLAAFGLRGLSKFTRR
jgi:hypothetical protein